jgi:sugar/nucleoside kinase (ribokinase family)
MASVTIVSEPLIELFGRGFSDQDEKPETPCSGDALNLAAAVSRGLVRFSEYIGQSQKHTVSVLCGLGDDSHGATIRSFMEREGLATCHVNILMGRKTAAYVIHREEGGAKRSVEYQNRGPDSAMCQLLEVGPHAEFANQAIQDISRHADILVITGIGASRARSETAFGKLAAMAFAVRTRGGKVIVDFNHRFHADTGAARLWVDDVGNPLPATMIRERMDRLFAVANLVFIAHDELWPVYGGVYQPPLGRGQEPTDARPMVAYLRGLVHPPACEGPRAVFFKRGKAGGTFYHQDERGQDAVFHTDTSQATTKDRNGGGDALIGGAIAGLLTGFTLEQSLNIGQHMAGKVIQHLGGVIRHNFLPDNHALDLLTRKTFMNNQAALVDELKIAPFVPVFQMTTHDGKNSIAEDAECKVEAMYQGGIRHFEFLLRGDDRLELDEYIAQVLAAIDTLAPKYGDAKFGVGTVSSLECMKRAAENSNVAFIVTAHWPGDEMIRTAMSLGKPFIPTVSRTDNVDFSNNGRIVAPGKNGTDTLNPQRIRALRNMGVATFKIFDFGRIASQRAKASSLDAQAPATLIAAGLVAIAEAIRDSHDGDIPVDQQLCAMITGGVNRENLPYLVASVSNGKMATMVREIAGGDSAAAPLIAILERTTIVAGGTFITRDYDQANDAESAIPRLQMLAQDVVAVVAKCCGT